MSTMASAEKIQEDFLTCSICYDVYVTPKCLPCLHTFCVKCLSSYIEAEDETYGVRRKQEFPCPMCRASTKPAHPSKPLLYWADDFITNFFVENLINEMHIRSGRDEPSEVKGTVTFAKGVDSKRLEEPSIITPPSDHVRFPESRYDSPMAGRSYQYSSFDDFNDDSDDNILIENLKEPLTRKQFKVVKFLSASMPGDSTQPKLCGVCVVNDVVVTLDFENKRIKTFSNWRVSLDVNIIARCLDLPSKPRSITKKSDSEVAVALAEGRKVYFVKVTPCLEVVNVVTTTRLYRNIAHVGHNMFVGTTRKSLKKSFPVDLVNYDGITLKSVNLSPELRSLDFISVAVSESGLIHVVSDRNNSLHCVTQEGVELYRYEQDTSNEQSHVLMGFCCHNDNIYMTDFEENSVYEICCDCGLPATREPILTHRDGLVKPTSVDVSGDGTVFIACWDGEVRVYDDHKRPKSILKSPKSSHCLLETDV